MEAQTEPPEQDFHPADLFALQRRLAMAERLAALGALVGNLAHELGTPLHSIAGYLDLMRSDPALPPAMRERMGIVLGEVDRLAGLIRSNLSRLRSPLPERQPVDVNALVRRVAELLRPALSSARVRLILDHEEGAGEPFPCDPAQVEQVIWNLVENALDAMPEGGNLTLRTARTETGRCISVCDDGMGIHDKDMRHVFEPFFSTKEAGEGTGLGLPLCREIARNHGGEIIIASRPGIGTVVTLTLGPPAPPTSR